METDRELLENAAKAAGYKKYYSHYLGRDSFVTYDEEYYSEIKERRVVGEKTLDWNPLTDDGDEARLEAALGLGVLWGSRTVTVGRKHFGPFEERFQEHNGDKHAARRRAGVRAAAEIGKSINGTSF